MIDSVEQDIFSELLSGNSRPDIDAGALGYVAWFEEKIKKLSCRNSFDSLAFS